MKKIDRRTFEDVLKAIEESELDVDKVLEAARLKRCENGKNKLDADQKENVIMMAIICATMLIFVTVLCTLFALG